MRENWDENNPSIRVGDNLLDYRVSRIEKIEIINSFYYELEHVPTGAKHIHISNSDTENTFSVAFKTVPTDSTGVAHILEHTVLCGSRNYPVRDPFFSMLKRSLSTFMNAFTASDWTMYPFSTQNQTDFYNLMDVYLDAAFYPKLDRLSFKQEGHRLEFEPDETNPDELRLVYKGVVYNEMKGAMSSPSQVMGRSLLNALYPSTTYSNNSGGEPSDIPSLTYEQLKHFHQIHYHPSNAFFYTYGHLPLKDHLAVIQEKILKHFDKIDPQTEVIPQPRWSEPKTVEYTYPLDPNENLEKKSQVCTGWLMADVNDSFEVLSLSILSEILLGNPAAPLRKALIDSGIGSALSDSTGYDSDLRDTLFACGLKDVSEKSATEIETIIFDVLKTLSESGIEDKLIQSALHQLEFQRKEITNTPYPYGLKLLLFISGSWFHGGDPVHVLNFESDLERIRSEIKKGRFFENQIKRHFLDNPHRVLFKLIPDPAKEREENTRVRNELERILSGLAPSEIEKIKEDTAKLKEIQESKEDISCLPTLSLSDIPPQTPGIKENRTIENITCYEQPTSGIFYFTGIAGVGTIPESLLNFIPFFCYAVTKVGTQKKDYTELSHLMNLYTGGIGFSAHARNRFEDSGECLPFVTITGKCLDRNIEKMFEILGELFLEFDFSDYDRIRRLLMEYRANYESQIVQNGHRLAISLSARNFSPRRSLDERWNGVHQFKTVKQITDELADERLRKVSEDLHSIGEYLFNQNNMKFALIGESEAVKTGLSFGKSLKTALKNNNINGFTEPAISLEKNKLREGWSTATAVSFVAQSFETVRMFHEDAPVLAVIARLMRSLYLHREIREKGGAYGGMSVYTPEDGLFCFASYRDPHIANTLKVYDDASNFMKSGDYSREDIKEAILEVCAELDKPDPPGPASRKAYFRKIISLSDDIRNAYKSKILSVRKEQVVGVARKYFDTDGRKHSVAVISSENKLAEENRKFEDNQLEIQPI